MDFFPAPQHNVFFNFYPFITIFVLGCKMLNKLKMREMIIEEVMGTMAYIFMVMGSQYFVDLQE